MLQLIQKFAAENCDTVDSEIGSQTVSLPIQKLAIKNCVAADLEIDSNGGVISSFNLPFFFFVFTMYMMLKKE